MGADAYAQNPAMPRAQFLSVPQEPQLALHPTSEWSRDRERYPKQVVTMATEGAAECIQSIDVAT